MLYKFDQNNSWWYTDTDDIICDVMIIEAENSEQALEIAEEKGIYFNGCEDWRDCECYWDRWSRWTDEIKFPYKWSKERTIKNLDEYIDYIILWKGNIEYFWKRHTRIFYIHWEVQEFNK